eukprot:m.43686 g.43686  ORF g.43686 m.43686 type:complete len:318 (-) comp8459_c0_seq2:2573-3526(-)
MKETEAVDTALVHALAGGGAAALALLLFFPLDVVRTHIQVAHKGGSATRLGEATQAYVKKHGWRALYEGVLPSIQTQWVSFFVYFFVYQQLKVSVTARSSDGAIGPMLNLAVAAAAGAVNVVVTAPLWLAATRLKMWRSTESHNDATSSSTPAHPAQPPSLWGLILSIAQTEGVATLWAGVGSSLVLVTNPMIQFAIYEQSKRLASFVAGTALEDGLPAALYFVLGGWAKVLATLTTYPLQVVQSRQRALKKSDDQAGAARGVFSAVYLLAREGGISGLYAGVDAKLAQTTLTNAFMFVTYEKLVGLTAMLLSGASS